MDAKLTNLCSQKLRDFEVKDGYITGFIEGDNQAYMEFFKLLNSQCSGFVKRSGGNYSKLG